MTQVQQTASFANADKFFARLQDEVAAHRALRHPFLLRFSEEKLNREQIAAFAAQHYMYSRLFNRNLAALVSNVPDENARSLLILNMYEEIGEPLRVRDRAHILLLEAGLVPPEEIGRACMQIVDSGNRGDIVQILLGRGVVTRDQLQRVVDAEEREARDLTHPAIFRRFLRALDLAPEAPGRIEPLPETSLMINEYHQVCRNGHWLEGMGAMGPGTECVVPTLYTFLRDGIERSGLLKPEDYLFWTIHIHCDDGHGANIIAGMRPYADTEENQRRIADGTRRVLDARAVWFDGMERMVFGASLPRTTLPVAPGRPLQISRAPRPVKKTSA